MNIQEIIELPTSIDKQHESLLRSYHILNYVLEMISRGDSADTIFEVVEYLRVGSKKK